MRSIGTKSASKNPETQKLAPKSEFHTTKTRTTGLEPATSGVTGRCSNQLSYVPWSEEAFTCVHDPFDMRIITHRAGKSRIYLNPVGERCLKL